ncbi:hypothetical protein QA601_15510 [Chitinispirillales bacterium ANBcel5]|uniref:toxin-antitoxin system YwqK family antitoxin n=1 Tax=Cellulosispirillum alkaliphilum TaxID=3039283 RepID=UPI002A4FEFD8|nr:hypothetical protein [Chitinispirillales bacterium ANBcel5]
MKLILIILLFTLLSVSEGRVCDTTIVAGDTISNCKKIENGVILRSESFVNSKRHGRVIERYSSGVKKRIISYEYGCPIDTSYRYYENGSIKTVVPYKVCEETVPAFNLSSEGDTTWIRYYNITEEMFRQRTYHPNHQLQSIIRYNENWQRHGLRETWREDGTRKDSIVYDNGEIIELRTYFLNGKVRNWTKVKDGRQDSVIFYDPEGNITGKIENGSGKAIRYSEDTTIRWFEVFEDGFRIDSRELEPGEIPSLD